MRRLLMMLVLLALVFAAVPQVIAERIELEYGPDTTIFEGPLREDGTVDYFAALNEQLSEGVTGENNAFAAIWLVRPLRNHHPLDETFAQMLGVVEEEGHPQFITFRDFMQEPGRGEPEEVIYDLERFAMEHPFVGDDLPDVIAWLERNEPALECIVTGLDRTHYDVPWTTDDETGCLIGILLPHLSFHRTYAKALQVRCNMAIGEGRPDDAIDDLLAIRRLGAMVKREPVLIANLVGLSIDRIAQAELQILLTHSDLSLQQLDRIEADWLPQVGQLTIAQVNDIGERMTLLDLVLQGWSGRLGDGDDVEHLVANSDDDLLIYATGALALARDDRFDVNAVLRRCNDEFDLQAEIFAADTYSAFVEQAMDHEEKINQDFTREEIALLQAAAQGRLESVDNVSVDLVTRAATKTLFRIGISAFGAAGRTEYHIQAHNDLAMIGVALQRYRVAHDGYPDSLDALVPDYMQSVPQDLFAQAPMHYGPSEDRASYLLYSVGRNQQDDGGSEESPNRDVVFRVGGE